ncbi:hypothetical protein ETAA8_58140 [Anatilimnocola aggregata]|uniref:DUF155 domain-containing protein n=1 Tax=Anatilimnocola aggregata TaxID=2528021 RepID=A0A517YKC9_9BACT|nr:hypothetical protein [Anatilimnocola aggregata]QDU30667.1 hypothetical protein ETAA8_58140 [Anatilimnocola aggregata]
MASEAKVDEIRVSGKLHCIIAFDWGESVDLEQAIRQIPAEVGDLPRRRRTPDAIAYRPSPVRCSLGSIRLPFPSLESAADAEVIVFEFGAANVAFRVPINLELGQLRELAVNLANQNWLQSLAHSVAKPIFDKLFPTIDEPLWNESYEEYFIFQIDPHPLLVENGVVNTQLAPSIVSLLRLTKEPLSDVEMSEALRCQISYGRNDIVFIDWAATVIIDCDCDETLHTIEFANLQLLEYRYLDQKVDSALKIARRQIQASARSWLPFWRTHARPLRFLTEIRMDAVGTFERADSTLQLVGDQYLSRVYRLLADRFHLREWAQNVRQAIDVTSDVHETLAEQSSMFRLELLELSVVVLIILEIVLAIVGT